MCAIILGAVYEGAMQGLIILRINCCNFYHVLKIRKIKQISEMHHGLYIPHLHGEDILVSSMFHETIFHRTKSNHISGSGRDHINSHSFTHISPLTSAHTMFRTLLTCRTKLSHSTLIGKLHIIRKAFPHVNLIWWNTSGFPCGDC